MSVNDVYESTIVFSADGEDISLSVHLLETSASNENAADTASAINPEVKNQFWTVFWQPFCSNAVFFKEVITQKIWPTREQFVVATTGPEAGTQIGDAMPAFAAILVTEYAENWGRRWTGKSFWPGLPETDELNGLVDGATITNIRAAADTAFLTPINIGPPISGEFTPAVFSRAQVKDGLTPTASAMATVQVNNVVTHQNRRRRPLTA